MVSRHGHCDSNRLREFLKTPFAEDGGPCDLSEHLEHCEKCRSELEAIAGGKWWNEVRPFVRTAANDEPGVRTQPNPDAPTEDADLNFLSPPDQPGHLGRFGPYQIISVLGKGGMGVVLKAWDPSLRRTVAIKVLSPVLATHGPARERFKREAQAAAAVVHHHVVAIFHIDVDKDSGLPYLVMPCVVGRSLQERLDRDGPLDITAVLRIGTQAAAGLAAAHAQGIVHRDVKPANILLENGVERVVLTDFGLARAVDDASLTQSGVIAGTPQYMSPEQARGEPTDHRSDLFSLGSVLYAMCAGRAPFRAPSALAVLRRVSDEHARPIREVNPAVPDSLAAVIEKLHAKDPADRFQTAAEVSAVLGQMLADLQKPGRRAATVPVAPPAAVVTPMPRRRGLHPALLAGLIVLLFAGMFAVVSGLKRQQNDSWSSASARDEDTDVPAAAEEVRLAQVAVSAARDKVRQAEQKAKTLDPDAARDVLEEAREAVREAEDELRTAHDQLREVMRNAQQAAHAERQKALSRAFAGHAVPPTPPVPGVPPTPAVPGVPPAPDAPPVPPIAPLVIDVPLVPLVKLDAKCADCVNVIFGGAGEVIVGSGKPETRSFPIKDFTGVEVRSPFALELKQGKEFKVSVTVDDNLFDHVLVEKEGKKLVIGFKGKNLNIRLNHRDSLKADVTLPELETLQLNGAAHATANGFTATRPVSLKLNGASQFKGSLKGTDVNIDANGASTVKLEGSGKNVRVTANGASHLRLGDFTGSGERLIIDADGASGVDLKGRFTAAVLTATGASHLDLRGATLAAADMTVNGSSHAAVRVTEKLDYSVNGASHLDYYGNPTIGKSSKRGASHVSHKD